jgi:hypothetical protein
VDQNHFKTDVTTRSLPDFCYHPGGEQHGIYMQLHAYIHQFATNTDVRRQPPLMDVQGHFLK